MEKFPKLFMPAILKPAILFLFLAVVAVAFPVDFFRSGCHAAKTCPSNTSYQVTAWYKLGLPHPWLTLIYGGLYGGGLQTQPKLLIANLALWLLIWAVLIKIKISKKKFILGVLVLLFGLGVYFEYKYVVFGFFVHPSFRLEANRKYKIWASQPFVFLGNSNGYKYELGEFLLPGTLPFYLDISKFPSNIGEFVDREVFVKGNLKPVRDIGYCPEYPCQTKIVWVADLSGIIPEK